MQTPTHIIASLQAALRAGMISKESTRMNVWGALACRREHLDSAMAWLQANA